MECYRGKSVGKGIAIGKLFFYRKKERQAVRKESADTEGEIGRYRQARTKAVEELKALYEKALREVGEVGAAIFETHQMMLEDPDFVTAIENIIVSQKVNAEYAVTAAGKNFYQMFSDMEDEYFRERAADVSDVTDRLLDALEGKEEREQVPEEPVILAAEDLAPSETVQMDKGRLLAFVTELGSSNSHTAILARTMNIPAVSSIAVRPEWDGRTAVVDGYSGVLYIDPEQETLEKMQRRLEEDRRQAQLLASLKGRESVTKSGRKILLYANIGGVADVASALANDAEGIGLFRSEFLYLEKDDYPREEELFQAYKAVAEMMGGKRVIIRTLDIGADKQAGYFRIPREENPAMGLRAIRICLERPEVFKTQLRAVFRAGVYGNLAVMYPMITSVDDVRHVRKLAEQVKVELSGEGIAFAHMEQGIMIETPAAALISDALAREVDFFSIGTNDLTQYTLAIDRQNPALDKYYDPHHPAVLRLIGEVIQNGHREGCLVGICGELGADTSLTETFIRMGIDELSVSPSRILPVRQEILRTE